WIVSAIIPSGDRNPDCGAHSRDAKHEQLGAQPFGPGPHCYRTEPRPYGGGVEALAIVLDCEGEGGGVLPEVYGDLGGLTVTDSITQRLARYVDQILGLACGDVLHGGGSDVDHGIDAFGDELPHDEGQIALQ